MISKIILLKIINIKQDKFLYSDYNIKLYLYIYNAKIIILTNLEFFDHLYEENCSYNFQRALLKKENERLHRIYNNRYYLLNMNESLKDN